MIYLDKKIELPQNKDGYFLMTKESIKLLKNANSIILRSENNFSFMRAIIEKKIDGENVSISYDMQLNKTYHNYYFCGHASYCKNKILLPHLMKENDIILPLPYKGAGNTDKLKEKNLICDKIYWYILRNNEKKFEELLDSMTTEENNSFRLVREK